MLCNTQSMLREFVVTYALTYTHMQNFFFKLIRFGKVNVLTTLAILVRVNLSKWSDSYKLAG